MATRHLSHLREAATLVSWNKKKQSKLEQERLDRKLLDVSFRYGIFSTTTLLDSMEKMQALIGKRSFRHFLSGFEPCIGQ